MPLFEADPETKAIAIYSEPGGRMEAELADWVREHKSRLPIVAFMAGRFMDEMPGMRFGHAGTIVEGKADTTADKIERMQRGRHLGRRAHRGHPGAGEGAPREGGTLTMAGMFIDVEVDAAVAADPALAKKLVEVCPVNIFAQDGRRHARASSRRTSTSARSASSASRPRPRARSGSSSSTKSRHRRSS